MCTQIQFKTALIGRLLFVTIAYKFVLLFTTFCSHFLIIVNGTSGSNMPKLGRQHTWSSQRFSLIWRLFYIEGLAKIFEISYLWYSHFAKLWSFSQMFISCYIRTAFWEILAFQEPWECWIKMAVINVFTKILVFKKIYLF